MANPIRIEAFAKRAVKASMHLVDTTLFFAARGGGVQRYLSAKRDWLRRHTSIRHTILAPGGADGQAGSGIVTLKSPALFRPYGFPFPLRLARWREQLVRLAPDLIEVGDPFGPAWSALRAGQDLGIPVIGFYHSDLVRLSRTRLGAGAEWVAGRYVRQLYREFDRVMAPSRYVAERLEELGVERVTHQPLGVDVQLFHPKRRDPQLRRKLGLAEDTRLLVFAGRFAHEKNLPVLLSALRRLGARYHLLLVGGGMRLPPQSNVTVCEYQTGQHELARLIASCDALAHAGQQETFGLVVLEAMACGLPVVGMADGGVAELVGERHGVLVRPGSGEAFAAGIEALYARDVRALGATARDAVEKSYSWNQVMQSLLALYRQRLLASWTSAARESYA
jgi:alpha-1,6-mannosyltransferase